MSLPDSPWAAPNFVARNISLRFPVLLNLRGESAGGNMRDPRTGRKFEGHAGVPFTNQLFIVAVDVSGVPEGTPRLVNGVQNLR